MKRRQLVERVRGFLKAPRQLPNAGQFGFRWPIKRRNRHVKVMPKLTRYDGERVSTQELRGRALLYDLFGKEQLDSYLVREMIVVREKKHGWVFSVYPATVEVFTPSGKVGGLCIGAATYPGESPYSDADSVISMALMAQTNPQQLLSIAGGGRDFLRHYAALSQREALPPAWPTQPWR